MGPAEKHSIPGCHDSWSLDHHLNFLTLSYIDVQTVYLPRADGDWNTARPNRRFSRRYVSDRGAYDQNIFTNISTSKFGCYIHGGARTVPIMLQCPYTNRGFERQADGLEA